MNKPFAALAAACALAGLVGSANAQVLIGSIQNRGGDSTNYYRFQNNGPNPPAAGGNFYTTSAGGSVFGSSPQTFVFNVGGTVFGGNNVRARISFNVATAGLCTTVGNQVTEALSGGVILVTVDPTDPTYGGLYGGQTLLNVAFGSSGIGQDTGSVSNPNPTFGAADPTDNVVITSPFVVVSGPERFSFSYSSGGNLSCNAPTNILNTINLGGNGTFSANTVQLNVPEPGPIAMLLGTGVTGMLAFYRRRKK